MKEQKETGGPAFPEFPQKKSDYQFAYTSGMTLRDYFAGQALAGWVTGSGNNDEDYVAQVCYEYADAMLKEREK